MYIHGKNQVCIDFIKRFKLLIIYISTPNLVYTLLMQSETWLANTNNLKGQFVWKRGSNVTATDLVAISEIIILCTILYQHDWFISLNL